MNRLSYRLRFAFHLVAALGGLALAGGGCQLIATVDRSYVPGSGGMAPTTTSTSAGGGGAGGGGMTECTTENVTEKCGVSTTCNAVSCDAGSCKDAPAALGLKCTEDNGTVCDGTGDCVAAHCTDLTLDGDETDVDCGGASCDRCVNELKCAVNTDCAGGYCVLGAGGAGGAGGSAAALGICKVCTQSSQCDVAQYCDSTDAKACVDDKANGAACGDDAECPGGTCVDGVCCDKACEGACEACSAAKGATTDGTCEVGAIKGSADTGSCDATNKAGMCDTLSCTCDAAGVCKSDLGATQADKTKCASGQSADGLCCNVACTDGCSTCKASLGADADGTCKVAAVKAGLDTGSCDATNKSGMCDTAKCTCDPAGVCKGDLGATQTDKTKCASGQSADGLCCNVACTDGCSTCKASLGADADGTCKTDGVKSLPDAGACDDSTKFGTCENFPCACSSAGVCKGKQGSVTASDNTHCLSGFAKDGRCCVNACTGGCQSCANAAGNCNAVVNVVDADTCDSDSFASPAGSAPAKCDAAGTCKGELAATCNATNQCNSGFCPTDDGKCCNAACTGVCKTCANGTCGNIAVLTDDNSLVTPCTGTMTCDGAGACKLDNGQDCSMFGAASCASGTCTGGICE